MEIEYTLTEADLVALAKHQIEKSPTAARRFGRRRWMYPAGLLLLAVGDFVIYHDRFIPAAFALLAVLAFALFPVYMRWLINQQVPRLVHARLTPAALGHRTLRLTAAGLEQIFDGGAANVGWEQVDRVDDTPAYVFISIDGTYTVVIPKGQLEPAALASLLAHGGGQGQGQPAQS